MTETKNWKICIRDLVLFCSIGVFEEELLAPQEVRFSLEVSVHMPVPDDCPSVAQVVCYKNLVDGLKDFIGRKTYNLIEVLAEEVANWCLTHPLIWRVWISVEKRNVFGGSPRVSIEIERSSCP